MPDLGAPFFVTSVLFGALTGYALSRSPEDRSATLAAAVMCGLVGVPTWLVATTGTVAEVAGASLTVGGISATLVLLALRGRPSRAI